MPNICPSCSAPLTADAPAGLCPACLLKRALETETAGFTNPGPPWTPPTIEELAPQFPNFEFIELLGRGGMGAVYKVRQKNLDRIAALKILPPHFSQDPATGANFSQRFTREARALARLNHPNIVTLYEFGVTPQLYFLMEFVDGTTLRGLMSAGIIPAREALTIIPQVCDALQFAHDSGIIHRDIKPENILLDKKGRVKVADFGLAKLIHPETPNTTSTTNTTNTTPTDPELTAANRVLGTPAYIAPEQSAAPDSVDHRADIYALGVVFYQMLTGQLPPKPVDPPSKKIQIDIRIDEIVLRALEQSPEKRYASVTEFRTQVETFAATTSASASQISNLKSQTQRPRGKMFEYRSRANILGLPLLHIVKGRDPNTGKLRAANGVIAIGTLARGFLALGVVAQGFIAIGPVAIGVFSLGILAIAVAAFGGLAIGYSAFGFIAIASNFGAGSFVVASFALSGTSYANYSYTPTAIAFSRLEQLLLILYPFFMLPFVYFTARAIKKNITPTPQMSVPIVAARDGKPIIRPLGVFLWALVVTLFAALIPFTIREGLHSSFAVYFLLLAVPPILAIQIARYRRLPAAELAPSQKIPGPASRGIRYFLTAILLFPAIFTAPTIFYRLYDPNFNFSQADEIRIFNNLFKIAADYNLNNPDNTQSKTQAIEYRDRLVALGYLSKQTYTLAIAPETFTAKRMLDEVTNHAARRPLYEIQNAPDAITVTVYSAADDVEYWKNLFTPLIKKDRFLPPPKKTEDELVRQLAHSLEAFGYQGKTRAATYGSITFNFLTPMTAEITVTDFKIENQPDAAGYSAGAAVFTARFIFDNNWQVVGPRELQFIRDFKIPTLSVYAVSPHLEMRLVEFMDPLGESFSNTDGRQFKVSRKVLADQSLFMKATLYPVNDRYFITLSLAPNGQSFLNTVMTKNQKMTAEFAWVLNGKLIAVTTFNKMTTFSMMPELNLDLGHITQSEAVQIAADINTLIRNRSSTRLPPGL